MKSAQGLPKEITNAAVEWLLEKQDGFAPGRAAQFQAWCEADPRHALAIDKAKRTFSLLGGLPSRKDELSERLEIGAKTEMNAARRRFWRLGWTWAAAAVVVVLASLTSVWWYGQSQVHEYNYVSNASRPEKLVLDDGSFVDLNANTTIRTRMLPRERRIALQEGEAHFSVAHDSSRPFIVDAAGIMVRAVGTAFTVLVREQQVEVLVSEGTVEILDPRREVATPSQLGVADRTIIDRGDTKATPVVEKVDEKQLREALSWHSQVTTISSRPLRDIVELFNRRNTLRIVIADPELAERNLGGSFTLDQPKAFVRALELDGDAVSELRGENEIVLRRRR